jgi:TonB family protein
LAENGNGHCIKYGHDFKRIYAEGDILNGLEEGVWHGFLEDSARYICTYEKGISKEGVSYDKKGNKYPFTTTDVVLPSFDGGINKFSAFLGRNIHYPTVAREKNVQGRVYITFAVNKDGQLSDLKIVRGLGSGCDEEVIRVMKASSPWVPGYQFGMPVRVLYTMPISFTLGGNY